MIRKDTPKTSNVQPAFARVRLWQLAQRPTIEFKTNLRKPVESADSYCFSAAITFNSIAMGVGNAVISIVVRVGFGLPSPAKYSA
jgi:hypothetical protein